jgi:aquaporin Z
MKTKALIAEFIGTFTLIFVGVGTVAASYIISGGKNHDIVAVALAHGLTVAAMVGATTTISGGHLNPAVTVGAWVGGKIDFKNAVGYIIFQCLGAIFAASLLKLTFPLTVLSAVNMGTPALGQENTPLMGLGMEFILTFFLVFVIFGTAIDTRTPKIDGLLIGLTVTFDILVGGPVSGASINPARYLGPALMGGNLQYFWLYWIGPLTGGAAAALMCNYVLQERNKSAIRSVSVEER